MTFEESLDRLKERHEALTQSVGLLLKETQTDAENIRALARIAEIRERQNNETRGERIARSMRLARI